jgi:hypothetical protein
MGERYSKKGLYKKMFERGIEKEIEKRMQKRLKKYGSSMPHVGNLKSNFPFFK